MAIVCSNENMAKLINSLKDTLSEKGVISELDLSSAIEVAEIEAVADSLHDIPRDLDYTDDDPTNHCIADGHPYHIAILQLLPKTRQTNRPSQLRPLLQRS